MAKSRCFAIRSGFVSLFQTVFHAVAATFDDDGFAMVEEAIKDGGGDGGVTIEDGRPLFEGFVGGEEDGAAFVACADHWEIRDTHFWDERSACWLPVGFSGCPTYPSHISDPDFAGGRFWGGPS